MTHRELFFLAQMEAANSSGLWGSLTFMVLLGIAAMAGLFLLVIASRLSNMATCGSKCTCRALT